jgi:hypothetical protein
LFTMVNGASTSFFSTSSFWINRAVVSLPLPADVLTMISTLRVGCHAGAAIAAAAKPRTTRKAEKRDAKEKGKDA